jgi:hypothetical protein
LINYNISIFFSDTGLLFYFTKVDTNKDEEELNALWKKLNNFFDEINEDSPEDYQWEE